LLAAVINRSVARLIKDTTRPLWIEALRGHMSPALVSGLEGVQADLAGRLGFERQLRQALQGTSQRGVFSFDEQLAVGVQGSPRAIVDALASYLTGAA
jgi:hypothetical protein